MRPRTGCETEQGSPDKWLTPEDVTRGQADTRTLGNTWGQSTRPIDFGSDTSQHHGSPQHELRNLALGNTITDFAVAVVIPSVDLRVVLSVDAKRSTERRTGNAQSP